MTSSLKNCLPAPLWIELYRVENEAKIPEKGFDPACLNRNIQTLKEIVNTCFDTNFSVTNKKIESIGNAGFTSITLVSVGALIYSLISKSPDLKFGFGSTLLLVAGIGMGCLHSRLKNFHHVVYENAFSALFQELLKIEAANPVNIDQNKRWVKLANTHFHAALNKATRMIQIKDYLGFSMITLISGGALVYSLATEGLILKKMTHITLSLIAGLGVSFLYYQYKTFQVFDAGNVIKALQESKKSSLFCEDTIIENIAQGIDLFKFGEDLFLFTIKENHVRVFTYLALLKKKKEDPEEFRESMTHAFYQTPHLSIKKVAFAFGINETLTNDVDLERFIKEQGLDTVLELGIDPNRIVTLVKDDLKKIQLAVSYGARIQNNRFVNNALVQACEKLDNVRISNLIELGAETLSKRPDDSNPFPANPQTPFEVYLSSYWKQSKKITSKDLQRILVVFNIVEPLAAVLVNFREGPFFETMNRLYGITISKGACAWLFDVLKKSESEMPKATANARAGNGKPNQFRLSQRFNALSLDPPSLKRSLDVKPVSSRLDSKTQVSSVLPEATSTVTTQAVEGASLTLTPQQAELVFPDEAAHRSSESEQSSETDEPQHTRPSLVVEAVASHPESGTELSSILAERAPTITPQTSPNDAVQLTQQSIDSVTSVSETVDHIAKDQFKPNASPEVITEDRKEMAAAQGSSAEKTSVLPPLSRNKVSSPSRGASKSTLPERVTLPPRPATAIEVEALKKTLEEFNNTPASTKLTHVDRPKRARRPPTTKMIKVPTAPPEQQEQSLTTDEREKLALAVTDPLSSEPASAPTPSGKSESSTELSQSDKKPLPALQPQGSPRKMPLTGGMQPRLNMTELSAVKLKRTEHSVLPKGATPKASPPVGAPASNPDTRTARSDTSI